MTADWPQYLLWQTAWVNLPTCFARKLRKVLEQLFADCYRCMEYSSLPLKFRASIRTNALNHNNEFAVHLLRLEWNPVLHLVDTHRRNQKAVRIRDKFTKDPRDEFIESSCKVYLECPIVIRLDKEASFASTLSTNCGWNSWNRTPVLCVRGS